MEDAEALARVQRRLEPLQRRSIQGWRAEILGAHAVPVAIARP
jgi:hypothetical protein